jgi:hypothetical protein
VVIAYLMHKHKMPFKDAHDRLKAAKYATHDTHPTNARLTSPHDTTRHNI